MEQEKQQDGPQLDPARKDIMRLEYQNNQLRAQVKKLQADRDAVHSALDEVHDSLEDTTLELETTRQELAIKCKKFAAHEHNLESTTSELQNARQELAIKCKELADQELKRSILPQQAQNEAGDGLQRLQMELQAKDEAISHQETQWKERTKKLYLEFETKLLKQEEEVQKLSAEQSLQHRKAESEWADNIRLLKDKYKHDLATVEQEVSQRLQAEFRIQCQNAESGLENNIRLQKSEDELNAEQEPSQELLLEQPAQLEEALRQIQTLQVQLQCAQQEAVTLRARQTTIRRSSAPNSPAGNPDDIRKVVEELQASHAAELEESRRLTHFFKSNSERVSREVRELRATTRTLMESVEAKDREIEDQLSHIYAIEAQIEELQNPPTTSILG